jgi:hypothetical protein
MADRKTDKPKWKYIDSYGIENYKCGLRAGDHLRLRRDLAVMDWRGQPTGKMYPAGEVWQVLTGASDDPDIVFLLKADGERCTWDDKPSIFEMFDLVEDNSKSS